MGMAARFGTRHPFTPKVDGFFSLHSPQPHSSPGSPFSHQNAAPVAGVGECPFPNQDFAECIVQGIRYGFRIGFDYNQRPQLRLKARNMGSAYEHPEVVHSTWPMSVAWAALLAQYQSHRRCSFKSAASPNGVNRTSGV